MAFNDRWGFLPDRARAKFKSIMDREVAGRRADVRTSVEEAVHEIMQDPDLTDRILSTVVGVEGNKILNDPSGEEDPEGDGRPHHRRRLR